MVRRNSNTKEEIFKNAKSLFYNNGYYNTSLEEIAALSNVNKAMIAYYFQNKSHLASVIRDEINFNIDEVLKKVLHDLGVFPDEVIITVIEYRLFASFRKLNNKYRRFIREICQDNVLLLSNPHDHPYNNFYKELCEKYGRNISNIDMEIYNCAMTSSLSGLIIMHDLGYLDCAHDFLAEKECEILLKILNLDQQTIDNILAESKYIFDQIHMEITKNFVIKENYKGK